MWGNIVLESYTHDVFNTSFPNQKSFTLIYLIKWQYFWWFWFSFFFVFYYDIFFNKIILQSVRMNPIITTSQKSHGKWGDLLICFLPIFWCVNILTNSNSLLKSIEWQTESHTLTLRVRGKQWYWCYKISPSDMAGFSKNNLIVGSGNLVNQQNTKKESNIFFKNKNYISDKKDSTHSTNPFLVENSLGLSNNSSKISNNYSNLLYNYKFRSSFNLDRKKLFTIFSKDFQSEKPNTAFTSSTFFKNELLPSNSNSPLFFGFFKSSKAYWTSSYFTLATKMLINQKNLSFFKNLGVFNSNYIIDVKQHNTPLTTSTCVKNWNLKDSYIVRNSIFYDNLTHTQGWLYKTSTGLQVPSGNYHLSKSLLRVFNPLNINFYYENNRKPCVWESNTLLPYKVFLKKQPNFFKNTNNYVLLSMKESLHTSEVFRRQYISIKQKSVKRISVGSFLKGRFYTNKGFTQGDYKGSLDYFYFLKNYGKDSLVTSDTNLYYSDNSSLKTVSVRTETDTLFNKVKSSKKYRFPKNKMSTCLNLKNNQRLLHTNSLLVLPTRTNLTIITNSFDVVHSWFIPGLGLKMDCVPGRSTHHSLFVRTSGFYYGQCAEICGRLHHHMPIKICFLPVEHFLVWWNHFHYKYVSTPKNLFYLFN